MRKSMKRKPKVVNAILGLEPEYVRIADWEGKSLSFILADEIRLEDKPGFCGQQKIKKEKADYSYEK
jgi:hypothetical protein